VNVLTGDVGTEFSCKNLIIDSSYVPLEYFNFEKPVKKISRCILITDRSIFDNSEENVRQETCLKLLQNKQINISSPLTLLYT